MYAIRIDKSRSIIGSKVFIFPIPSWCIKNVPILLSIRLEPCGPFPPSVIGIRGIFFYSGLRAVNGSHIRFHEGRLPRLLVTNESSKSERVVLVQCAIVEMFRIGESDVFANVTDPFVLCRIEIRTKGFVQLVDRDAIDHLVFDRMEPSVHSCKAVRPFDGVRHDTSEITHSTEWISKPRSVLSQALL